MADRISFSTAQLMASLNPATAPDPFGTAHVGGTTAFGKRVLAAIVGDGDSLLEAGENGHVLAGFRNDTGGVKNTATLNGAQDPVSISGHGWQNLQTTGALSLDAALVYTAERGFALRTPGTKAGDSLTWTLNDKAGVAQHLDAVSFVVDTGAATAPVSVVLDVDGAVVASGTYAGKLVAPARAPLAIEARHGDVVAIDFAALAVTVNGQAQTGPAVDLFFARYLASPQNAVTVGGLRGFSVKDLVLDRSDQGTGTNTAPHLLVTQTVAELFENAATDTPIKVADIEIVDDGRGTNALTLTGADAALFEIVGTELFLRAGAVLDFETNPRLDVRVEVDDPALGASPDASRDLSVAIGDAVEDDGRISFAMAQLRVAAGTVPDPITAAHLGTGTVLRNKALVAITGDGDGQLEAGELGHVLAGARTHAGHVGQANLNGAEDPVTISAHGWISGNTTAALDLNRTVVFNPVNGFGVQSASTKAGDSLTWTLNDRAGVAQQLDRLSFVVATATAGQPVEVAFDFDGNTVAGGIYRNGAAATRDAALALNLAGGDAVAIDFEARTLTVNGTARSGPAIDAFFDAYAASAQNAITIGGVGRTGFSVKDLVLDRSDADIVTNLPPAIGLAPALTALPENADLRQPLKVAEITLTDDGVGTNDLRLAGAHAGLFEIVGRDVFLRAGATLDHETLRELSLTVEADDPAIGAPGSAEASATLTIAVTDVDESWGSITLDGSTADWAASSVLSTQSAGGVNHAVRGTFQDGAFVIALQADGGTVGADTTVWLNTDLNKQTGFEVFGWAAGAEYNINFGPDGRPALYTGDAGQTFVANLDFVFNAAHSTIEIALPSALVGGATRAEIFVDVNDAVFLPGDYSNGLTFGEKPPLLPVDPTERIAIVYSETSANQYFDKTAYGQLFMAAQHQAMQAGIPFDILSEADLTDIDNLAGYDAIVFPGFSHVQSSRLQGITDTLTTASQDYGIGMIAMGNFLTNTETGAAIAGDSYARMKAILGVTLDGFGATDGVTLRAETGSHPVSDLYTPNELVGTYSNNSYQTFRDVSGSGLTLFTQTVNGQDLSAVIATTTGGRNVHFATDAVFGNNNILHEAIKWAAQGDAPEVSLQMTRGNSLFFSRNDMDQSQEIFDVITQNPGIYDKMIPILEQWYEDFGFVGSYYVNVGANPAEFQETDWSVSRPYYQRILALESEIGTHSFTHPHDTNLLLPDVITEDIRARKIAGNPDLQPLVANMTLAQINQQLAAALAATDPSGTNPVPRSSLSQVQQALLEFSLRFQFDYSRQIIERELGLTDLGAAVPGAPEKIDASFGMLEHLSYLTGGYSGVGAGYPGAFGFLDPDHKDKVYFAPNVSFDFSLIEFQKLTPAQAEARWAAEFDQITGKGSAPIIHFPWHDYGPTNWGGTAGYTLQMFTNFLARAHAGGTEFVTGADLAHRIETFAAADLQITDTPAGLRATVSGSDLGTFALELEQGQTIAHAGSWYAFSDGKVFVDRDGGTFDITLGQQAADVTHVSALPMRAELISVTGDGTDLAFSFFGRGEVGIDLRSWGGDSVVASGADAGTLSGDRLTLAFDAIGNHSASVDYRTGATVAGTAGNDVVIGSDQGRRIDGAGGDDTLFGGLGADTFVFGRGTGSDVVLDFAAGADRIELVGSGFATAAAALAGFAQVAGGVELAFSATQKLFLADILLADLDESHLILTNAIA